MLTFNKLITKPPAELFHYTSIDGLYGIIHDGDIWASKIRYLNDSREFLHAFDLARRHIFKIKSQNKYSDEFFNKLVAQLDASQDMHVFVCSFTEKEDQLSQWRAYSGDSTGYSIGFNAADLKRIAWHHGFYLCKCIYSKKDQDSIIYEYFNKNLSTLYQNKDPEFWASTIAEFILIATLLKNNSFSQEDEWRLISKPKSCTLERFCFRKSKTTLIPYYSVPIREKSDVVNLTQIICGPNQESRLAESSLRALLKKNNYKRTQVLSSKIPLRQFL
jgi:hypothetical protein